MGKNGIDLVDAGGEIVGHACASCERIVRDQNSEQPKTERLQIINADTAAPCFRCASNAARALRAIPSERRTQAARDNGKKGDPESHRRGGRPKKEQG
jgi:hypothetical protein